MGGIHFFWLQVQKAIKKGFVLWWSLKHLTGLMRGGVHALCVMSRRGHWLGVRTLGYMLLLILCDPLRCYHIYCAAAWRVVGEAANWQRAGVRCGERWREQAFRLQSKIKYRPLLHHSPRLLHLCPPLPVSPFQNEALSLALYLPLSPSPFLPHRLKWKSNSCYGDRVMSRM